MPHHILGIDLGTTNCCAAIYDNKQERIILSAEGGRTIPSVVSFSNGKLLIGQAAKDAEIHNPGTSISSVKRFMGSSHKTYKIGDKELSPVTVSGLILKKIKDDAEAFLGEKIRDAIITVPAYFDDLQRQATIDAGRIAGLNVVRILNEPSAAALAYSVDRQQQNSKVMVFDFGGGTLDVSIVHITPNSVSVISTAGINDLGGDDIDNAIVRHLVSQFYRDYKINLNSGHPEAIARLKEAAEEAKIALTSSDSYDINVPHICVDKNEPRHIEMTLTREFFEQLLAPVVKNISIPIETAVKDAKLKMSDISEVLLVGGSTRIPYVQKRIEEITGITPHKTINPDEAVAIGAAIQGSIVSGRSLMRFSDITSLSLSIRTASDLVRVIIPRNTQIPVEKSYEFLTSTDDQEDVVIEVFQGEREFYYDNKKIAHFILDDIPTGKVGEVKIVVTFSIDHNGILTVKAAETSSGVSNDIQVRDYLKLTDKEIEEAIRIAEYFKTQDRERREIIIEKKNAQYILELLTDIKDSGLNISIDEQEQIEKFMEREKIFLEKKSITPEDIDSITSDNILIKSFIFEIQRRAFEE